jgi:hypothetical protein
MDCIICNNKSNYFITKEFEGVYKGMIVFSEYYKCPNCGFTFSPTIFKLNTNDFIKLNLAFHKYIEDPLTTNISNQPPYIEQALMLNILEKNSLIDLESYLDYAGGYGTLKKIMEKYFNWHPLLIYDPYMQDLDNNEYISKEKLRQYNTVFNSAIFEHITCRETLEEINSCVTDKGVLIIHTVVCENIPNDSNWFYINPVHSAFHTNKSMEILMKQWQYKWSIYCPSSKCWILFKSEYNNEGEIIDRINQEFQTKYFYYKTKGFVDYWKGF